MATGEQQMGSVEGRGQVETGGSAVRPTGISTRLKPEYKSMTQALDLIRKGDMGIEDLGGTKLDNKLRDYFDSDRFIRQFGTKAKEDFQKARPEKVAEYNRQRNEAIKREQFRESYVPELERNLAQYNREVSALNQSGIGYYTYGKDILGLDDAQARKYAHLRSHSNMSEHELDDYVKNGLATERGIVGAINKAIDMAGNVFIEPLTGGLIEFEDIRKGLNAGTNYMTGAKDQGQEYLTEILESKGALPHYEEASYGVRMNELEKDLNAKNEELYRRKKEEFGF